MARALKAFIDCSALKHNLRRVKENAPSCSVMAMVKANGYGHGIVTVAEALSNADAFGVACIEEASQLYNAGITKPIVLMEGFFEANELPDVLSMNLHTVVHNHNHVRALQAFDKGPIIVWIKINTGMHRLGFPVEEVKAVWQTLNSLPNIKIAGILTHFARSDELDRSETQIQIDRFTQVLRELPESGKVNGLSLANSAGVLGWPNSLGNWVRPGIMLYGVSPFNGRLGKDEGLIPVMTLSSKLIAIQKVKKGDAVGYGGTYVASEDMPVGVVAIGYGDGYPRLMPTGTPVLVNGTKVPLVGRVSMDMITVDLRAVPNAAVGDPVQLWGTELPVEEVAAHLGTTAYELLTGLSPRVPFEIQDL